MGFVNVNLTPPLSVCFYFMPEKNKLRFTEIRRIETAVLAIEKECGLKSNCTDNQFG